MYFYFVYKVDFYLVLNKILKDRLIYLLVVMDNF